MNFNEKYNHENFIDFLEDFLPADFKEKEEDIIIKAERYKEINKAIILGFSESLDLHVLEMNHGRENDPRIAIATDAFKILADHWIHKALVIFKNNESSNYRLSLLTISLDLNEKNKAIKKYSNARRYSFYLGPSAKINTPTKFLINKGKVIDFEDLKDRFSIEVVNKDFYKEISNAFIKLVGGSILNGKSKIIYETSLKLPSSQNLSKTNLEFAVRLIGRVIFCWFLREKKSNAKISLMPQKLLSLEAVKENKDYYHQILETIFFELLNKKARKDEFSNDLFSLIPYLNGGLFSNQDDDFYKRNSSDFQSQYHNTLIIPDKWFSEFFEVLETYNFTIDENTSFDEELSIDPEMLGRIFENLLAEINPETGESARKSTGSYYTPRVIVDYMVDESLLLYLKEQTKIDETKLRAIISYDLNDDINNPITDDEKQKIVNALEKVKILDPACGSGAFPIGALQKIVFILQQIDPNGKLWKEKQLAKADPEFRKDIEKRFSNKEYNFIRKLGIIRDCIYGIDIQPIATEISRLRCFLTLIVDEQVEDEAENRGIKPLPNLDFKFVTANSLIGLPKVNEPQGTMFDDYQKIDELKKIRDEYFNSSGIEREQLKTQFVTQQKLLFKDLQKEHGWQGINKAELTNKLTDWDPFTHNSTPWFDPEWMFGIKDGFDIVIANPPYVDSENMTKNDGEMREMYNSLYTTTKGNWDLFVVFIERGDQLLNNKGVLTYIVPNKLIGAKYSEAIRTNMLERKIDTIRDYSSVKVFKDVSVYPIVFLFSKNEKEEEPITIEKMADLDNCSISNSIPGNIFYEDIYWDRYFVSSDSLKLILKISKFTKLYEYNKEVLGAATVNEAYELKKVIKEFTDERNQFKKLINTGTIDPYRSKWGIKRTQYIKSSFLKPIILDNDLGTLFPNRFAQANNKKIIIGGMTKRLEAFLDDGKYLAGKSTTIIIDNGKIDLIYLLAILNSKLISFWYKIYFKSLSLAGGFLRISNNEIKKIPIPESDNKVTSQIVRLANEIMDITKSDNQDVNTEEKLNDNLNQIDQVVYKLYGLNQEEISIIENSTNEQ